MLEAIFVVSLDHVQWCQNQGFWLRVLWWDIFLGELWCPLYGHHHRDIYRRAQVGYRCTDNHSSHNAYLDNGLLTYPILLHFSSLMPLKSMSWESHNRPQREKIFIERVKFDVSQHKYFKIIAIQQSNIHPKKNMAEIQPKTSAVLYE